MKNGFILLVLLLFVSCNNNKRVPGSVLPKMAMKEVLWDMMEADEFIKQYVQKDSAKDIKAESEKLYEKIFKAHKITREEFKRSLRYYESRPDLLMVVMDSLNRKGSRIDEESYKPRPLPVTDTAGMKTILKGKTIE